MVYKMTYYAGLFLFYCLILDSTRITGQLHEQYVGCFVENGKKSISENGLSGADNLTIEICIQKCFNGANSAMTFAALTNGRRCTCRNYTGQRLNDHTCDAKCSGNQLQFCGGTTAKKRYSLYTVCPVGYFGPKCDHSCHCERYLPCDRETGICPDGCEEQWTGKECNISNISKQYIGCYGDGPENEAKQVMDVKNPGGKTGGNKPLANSIEFCIEICSTNNYTYAGMQYGYDCLCGEKYDRYGNMTYNGMQVNCSVNCPANGNQRCGGNYANSVYYVCPIGFYGQGCFNRCKCSYGNPCRFNGSCLNSTLNFCKPGWTGSACNIRDCKVDNGDCTIEEQCEAIDLGYANITACQPLPRKLERYYVGCFQSIATHSVGQAVDLKNATELTIDTCIVKCRTQTGLTFAGVMNGSLCFCTDTLGVQLAESSCGIRCTGSNSQFCGGVLRNGSIAVYSAYTVCSVGHFGTKCGQLCHCKRHLPCDRNTGLCPDGCEEKWTGISCNITKQYIGCYGGGPQAMDVKNPGGLTGGSKPNDNSIEFCIEICSTAKFTYAGMEYGYDCWCGEQYDKYGNRTYNGKQVNCNFSCPANTSQVCGGDYAISVHHVCPIGFYGQNCSKRCKCSNGGPCRFNGSCLNSTLTFCKPGWRGSACHTRDCGINNGGCETDEKCEILDLGFANMSVCRCKDGSYRDNNTCRQTSLHYVGCYQGSIAHYVAPELPTTEALTIEICMQLCRQLNKTYTIIQGGVTCLCGDVYGDVLPDSDCQVPCAGNKQQYCGRRTTADKTPIYVVYTAKSFLRQYIGCYKDAQQAAMEKKFSWSTGHNNTIESCVRHCAYHNYTYAGLQYGFDCFCGNSYNKYGPLPESRCNMNCSGNPKQTCGGNYANSLYSVNDIFWCSNDSDCKSKETCTVVDLKYMNISRCRCKQGFHRNSQWEYCTDVDECQSGTSACNSESANCINSIGSYRCECKNGFLMVSDKCIDIDECRNESLICNAATEQCKNTFGSYVCQCKNGYVALTNGQCTDIDECLLGWPSSNCSKFSENCINSNGAFACECKEGFTNISGNCQDIDECLLGWPSSNCSQFSENCINSNGSFACECKEGFTNISGKCEDDLNNVVFISMVCLLVVIAIVAFVLVLLLRKRICVKKEDSESKAMVSNSNHKQDKTPCISQETPLYAISSKQANTKIPVGELPANLKTKRSQQGSLEEEFKSVPVEDSSKTCREGKKKELKHRNRFQNIVPYDENRVILRKHNNQFSDYINASFIKSYNSEEKIIATQGPNPDTLTDFWQMISENVVGTIVMITNLVENAKKKCACYWPESDDSLTVGDMTIKLKFTEIWPSYVIRHLQLITGSGTMDIKQWHFTVWPDHGVPSDVKGFLNFRRNVRQSMSLDKYTIVHCSAGVGRTGTFIAINYLLEQAEAEGLVDVLGCLRFLRKQRPHMVQTLDQYEFIYTALATEFTVGKTAIKAEDFDYIYQNLMVRDKLSGKTQLEIQFQLLQEQWSHHSESENPFHVFPKSLDMSDISEDAQAVFVQSWKTKDAYIVPEYPDKNTIDYFWTICLDFECKFVIYLDNGKNLQQFFPRRPVESISLGSWRILCKSSDKEQYGTRLNVALNHISESEYANTAVSTANGDVTLLNVMAYVNDKRLNYDAIHSIYSTIKELKSKNGANKATPVVIVSGPNCPLSGLYVAAFNAFDMLAEGKEVDLYQVVYDVKKSRSKLIPSLVMYEELHNIVNHRIGYTSSATVYSNV